MSATAKSTENTNKSSSGAESPTTARPLEMDDDDVQESGIVSGEGEVQATATPPNPTVEDEEVPPPKPPRPLSPQQQAENTLKEAFPSIDAAVVKAVLTASGGRVEPAFNALLGMSDPDAAREIPPPQPPRPTAAQPFGSTPQSQLEADEQYARQLAEHYGGGGSYGPRSSSRGAPYQQSRFTPNEQQYEERSFIDDDLPVIKENLRKGFIETQTRVNGWITNLRKRIDGEGDDSASPQGYGSPGSAGYRPRRSGDGRQSSDYNRYDADPAVLSDDFAGIQMNDDDEGAPPRRSTRPLANPDLFKPTPATPKSGDSRKVAFQGGPPEEIKSQSSQPGAGDNASTPSKQSKWQPLSAVDPSPIGEGDNDPFSLGDSEDEKETKDRVGGKEVKADDAERLKKAAAEAMADTIGGGPEVKPEPAETSGTKDKIAEDLTSKP